MTTEDFENRAKEIISILDRDGDPYMFVHFSTDKDAFCGLHDRMDKFDAIMVMKQMFQFFEMTDDDLQTFSLITKGNL